MRNTAVPGTRCGGFASSLRTSQSRSASLRFVTLARTRVPRTQVNMMSSQKCRDDERHPTAFEQLQNVGREEGLFNQQ